MILSGKLRKALYDGYERYLNIEFNESIGLLWCYSVNSEEYVESSCAPTIESAEDIKITLSIEWVTNYVKDPNNRVGFKQTINESSHIDVTADVIKVIDEYTVICNIGILSSIVVEFEAPKSNISIGDRISFSGNLKATFST